MENQCASWFSSELMHSVHLPAPSLASSICITYWSWNRSLCWCWRWQRRKKKFTEKRSLGCNANAVSSLIYKSNIHTCKWVELRNCYNWATNGTWIGLDIRGYCEIRWNPASDINIVPFIETGYLQSSAFYAVIQGNGFPMR